VNRTRCPPQFTPVLRELSENGGHYFGNGAVSVEPLHHYERPFSTVLKIRVAGAARPCDAFIKIAKPYDETPERLASARQSVVHEFEITSRVHAGLTSHAGLCAVRPIACFPEHLAIVTEEAEGVTLDGLLRRSAGRPSLRTIEELAVILGRIGAWLHAFQAVTPAARPVSLESMYTYLDRRLAMLEASEGESLTSEGRQVICRYFERLGTLVSGEVRAVSIHGDLCPENIVTRDGLVTVLDFTMAKTGSIYHDVAHLSMHIDLLKTKPWFSGQVVDRLNSALLNGFEPGLSDARPLFALVMLQHVACHLLSLTGRPRRSALERLYANRVCHRHREWLTRHAGAVRWTSR
jgi:hypothetical protein